MRDGMRLTALHFAIVSGLVLITFAFCEGVQGLRHVLLPEMGSRLHAVFLPFGAMVLLTWFYGWMAVPLILPAAVLAVGMIVGADRLDAVMVAVLTAKVVAVPVTFDLFRLAGLDARGEGRAANWRVVVVAGLVAALIGNLPRVIIGPCCTEFSVGDRAMAYVTVTAADMAGVILVLLAAMGMFRALRQG